MARPTETEKVYLAIIASKTATDSDRLQASMALDKLRNQRTHYRNHTKAKSLLGIGAKEAKRDATSKIADEVPENLKRNQFARETYPTWPKEKREFWLKVWALEN